MSLELYKCLLGRINGFILTDFDILFKQISLKLNSHKNATVNHMINTVRPLVQGEKKRKR